MKYIKPLTKAIALLDRAYQKYVKTQYYKSMLGHCGRNLIIKKPRIVPNWSLIYMYDNTNLLWGFTFISDGGRFIMKRGSGAAQGLTVITGSHVRQLGKTFKDERNFVRVSPDEHDKDVILEEDVWIGANVTLCDGVTIGRCANVGAGSVVRNNVPPYSVVVGNPAKIIGFCFTPEEIIEHEKALYPEEERLPLELLEKNYEKYFLKRIKEIKEFTRL